jgi:hypothetical protein
MGGMKQEGWEEVKNEKGTFTGRGVSERMTE